MIIQLQNPIPIITPRGKGLAHFLIDEGIEHHLKWVVFLDTNGECWTFQNPDIRAQNNITQGREHISPFYKADDMDLLKKQSDSHIIHMRCTKCLLQNMVFFKDATEWECYYCGNKMKEKDPIHIPTMSV